MYTVHNQDILTWAKNYIGPKFHSMVLDPPYHLTSITERFGKQGSAPAQHGTDGAFARASRGFMNATWDGGDIAFQPETWAALSAHLYPGAINMAFASTRGFHRMATAIEGLVSLAPNEILEAADMLALARATKDWSLVEEVELWLRSHIKITNAMQSAGFIIHPTIFTWAFGSGFPKATGIANQLDDDAFVEWLDQNLEEKAQLESFRLQALNAKRALKADPTSNELKALAILTRKAYTRTRKQIKTDAGFVKVVETKKQSGAKFKQAQELIDNGGFNDPNRSEFDVTGSTTEQAREWAGHRYGGQALKPALEPIIVFQKPYEGDPVECITRTGAGAWNIDAGRIKTNGETLQASTSTGSKYRGNVYFDSATRNDPYWIQSIGGRWPSNLILSHSPECGSGCVDECPVKRLNSQINQTNDAQFNDKARFFFNADYALDRIEQSDPLFYVPKASSTERDAGLHQFEQITVNDGRDTPIDNAYQRGETSRHNPHPTVKPIKLTKYLASLTLPPKMYAPNRRLLVPFSGVGSEIIGGLLAGWDEVVGIELEALHAEVAEVRIDWWVAASKVAMTTEPKEILELVNPEKPVDTTPQYTMFDMIGTEVEV